ncbi:MAG: type VII toxin-antitoxin system MntA family adenylyltransferase antitoxin [Candidatus Woesearchaeota archaeon]
MDLKRKIRELDENKRVLFAMLFGSKAKGASTKLSDIDVAIYYQGNKKERFDFLKNISGILGKGYDIHIFQDLPHYVQKEVIKHGKVIMTRDVRRTTEIIIQTIRECSRAEKYMKFYYERLERDAHERY